MLASAAAIGAQLSHPIRFKNVIVYEGRCGSMSGGSYAYVQNRDRHNRYRVTVRRSTRHQTETYDRVYTIEAGQKKRLGCTEIGSFPVSRDSYQVVGESRL